MRPDRSQIDAVGRGRGGRGGRVESVPRLCSANFRGVTLAALVVLA